MVERHTCVRNFRSANLMDLTWIARQFLKEMVRKPNMKCKEMQAIIQSRFHCKDVPFKNQHVAKSQPIPNGVNRVDEKQEENDDEDGVDETQEDNDEDRVDETHEDNDEDRVDGIDETQEDDDDEDGVDDTQFRVRVRTRKSTFEVLPQSYLVLEFST
ncbi:unnamed protein product [Lactuca virosa]|uniref:Uncharacterized protein n=1 Tax=Lactuca virosa TaxID=75947 RepID=A0AAU9MHV7_9ASTR|nr:unnamed protein product [Lactuca virosa]